VVYACSHLCLLCSSCSVVCCLLICTVCAAYIAYAFHTISHVMSVMIPWSSLSQVLETRSYVAMHLCSCHHMLLGKATIIALGVTGFAPLECDLSVLIKIQAASPPCSHRLRTQAHSDSQTEQLQRAGHEPVCLVPGSVDKLDLSTCLCLIALFKRASTHILRAFYSADIGITTNTTSDFSSTCVVLALVAGRQDFQP